MAQKKSSVFEELEGGEEEETQNHLSAFEIQTTSFVSENSAQGANAEGLTTSPTPVSLETFDDTIPSIVEDGVVDDDIRIASQTNISDVSSLEEVKA